MNESHTYATPTWYRLASGSVLFTALTGLLLVLATREASALSWFGRTLCAFGSVMTGSMLVLNVAAMSQKLSGGTPQDVDVSTELTQQAEQLGDRIDGIMSTGQEWVNTGMQVFVSVLLALACVMGVVATTQPLLARCNVIERYAPLSFGWILAIGIVPVVLATGRALATQPTSNGATQRRTAAADRISQFVRSLALVSFAMISSNLTAIVVLELLIVAA
ncbi:MAG: hypothetical protein KDA92_20455 [Planctomycetales bacterium]|nr:hypothetical protein [Planctomycetales bacterium]